MSDILRLDHVSYTYPGGKPVLRDVSLSVAAGRSIGLVGQSGSGKSTILKLLLGLLKPQSGAVTFDGVPLSLSDRALMRSYRRSVQAVFQDPYASLDPRQRVGSILAEPLRSLAIPGDRDALVAAALADVGLDPAMLDRYPDAFSGGQRQRIAIARAIVAGPRVILADEAVSALDLTTKVRIVDLFKTLASRMTLLFVSHDLGVVAALCDEIVILAEGRVVEAGPTQKVLAAPAHPYTRSLLASVPRLPAFAAGDPRS